MTVSIIIPVYNEEKTVKRIVEEIFSTKLPNFSKEVIIVDDCSTDNTSREIKKLFSEGKKIKHITHKKNLGKGAAIKSGVGISTGEYIIIQDADLEYSPSDIPSLLTPINAKKAQVVYGSRLKRLPNFRRDERTVRFFVHYVGNKFLSLLTSILYGQWISDMETGYKLIPSSIIKTVGLQASGFEFEAEITAKILKKGYKIIEVPISTNPRGYGQGKKLQTIPDGIKALTTLIKYRFSD